MLVIGLCCTAAGTPSFPRHHCSHSAFTHGKEPVSLEVLCMFSNILEYGFLQSGYGSCCYTIGALPFLLQKQYKGPIHRRTLYNIYRRSVYTKNNFICKCKAHDE
jgi:hypothetical protein